MHSQVRKLPGEPLFIEVMPEGYNLFTDLEGDIAVMIGLLDAQSEPVDWIIDLQALTFTMDEVLMAASELARGDNPAYHHRNLRQVIFVTTNKFLEMAAKGMDSDAFGHLSIPVFTHMDEAIQYAHSNR